MKKEYSCHACKEVVQKDATKCPHCGTKHPTISNGKGCLGVLILSVVIGFLIHSCADSNNDTTSLNALNNTAETTTPKWYKNGSLQNESALVWQQSSHAQKLSTAANIYAAFWLDKTLSPNLMSQIKSMNDLKPFAEKLVIELDSAFKPASTEKENKMIFANQKVSEAAVLILMMNNQLIKK
ncbi:hypothetical protein GLP30_09380 [Photobacterium phosphoreum]|uniref:Zinc ribbon domain-containing protein n=2 Tax=Photobacterium TaxID=657 RepID=A0ABU6L5S1_9GAMM|nr:MULTISPECIES: zinc ribbon domain-containing protein [Photobacterium]MCD9491091.1 hypothetical protein [Photobacterium phosphoreum]MCF2190299.1 hypothetical protein [Photobacterium phosphoreum]MCF2300886.1 hypothetical protein [Photobacterium phosphoreum]MEC6831912.1 zinc ribbon domain-containing protein [Photobacterium toruni]